MEGSNPSIGGSCASQDVVSSCTALRRSAWWPRGSARKCVGRDVGPCPWVRGVLGGRASRCWVALLDSPEAGALRRGGRRRCRFELVDGVGVIMRWWWAFTKGGGSPVQKPGCHLRQTSRVSTAKPSSENSQEEGTGEQGNKRSTSVTNVLQLR
jgi:hypothetical protein